MNSVRVFSILVMTLSAVGSGSENLDELARHGNILSLTFGPSIAKVPGAKACLYEGNFDNHKSPLAFGCTVNDDGSCSSSVECLKKDKPDQNVRVHSSVGENFDVLETVPNEPMRCKYSQQPYAVWAPKGQGKSEGFCFAQVSCVRSDSDELPEAVACDADKLVKEKVLENGKERIVSRLICPPVSKCFAKQYPLIKQAPSPADTALKQSKAETIRASAAIGVGRPSKVQRRH